MAPHPAASSGADLVPRGPTPTSTTTPGMDMGAGAGAGAGLAAVAGSGSGSGPHGTCSTTRRRPPPSRTLFNHFHQRPRPPSTMSALRPNQREKAASKHGSSGIAAGLANGIANGLIDPTKLGKYPVLLSDTLLGRTQKDVFTSVRYNHKPQLSSDQAPALARLKPETPGTRDNFELSYSDAGGTYGYAGTRSTDSNQYVLYFDDAKKAFILDRVDSTFNMNLTRTPETTDPERLRQQRPR
ncbi:conserved hypothetical protein [Verticillium alfalfae VaMs.102]|uniref:Transcription elongation factor Eaf N-terminal domain-containing protein n=1 Tax=Verticillium alfalfae (strain VaMs.102 / ATCC MYA-4576 / FGSC 10136) TaxID=526221 RepID=C9S6X7_VERA1|nr:conserved hypothetical protein [Verticillium alfalfae VaMs.102]EEY14588.1 conserved hypothetical protein [Verticillium alfalfae VaMs.102]